MKYIEEKNTVNVILELNARLQPLHRGEIFEDMFEDMFSRFGIGEINGGGTLLMPSGEVEKCDIEMTIYKNKLNPFISLLNRYHSKRKQAYNRWRSHRHRHCIRYGYLSQWYRVS